MFAVWAFCHAHPVDALTCLSACSVLPPNAIILYCFLIELLSILVNSSPKDLAIITVPSHMPV